MQLWSPSLIVVHEDFLGLFPLGFLLFSSELVSDTKMMVGRSMGTPDGAFGLLPLLGCLVLGLAMASMTILGEEFLDGEDEVVPASMSIAYLAV